MSSLSRLIGCALAVLLSLALAAQPARAEAPAPVTEQPSARLVAARGAASARANDLAPHEKKAARIADKQASAAAELDPAEHAAWARQLRARVGKPAPPVINIFNTWTHERMAADIAAEHPPGKRPPATAPVDLGVAVQRRVNAFFRCHFTGEPMDMDPRLFAALVSAARHFGARDIHIVSGFRAPKYNLMLRKKGREVARKSQHTLGSAIDFRLIGVPVRKLHAWVTQQRLGGVGLYVGSGFVHMDTGPIRFWQGR
ncbi:YcbK family protein [Haliangium ochraceum]|uniref:Murein endopeptidase K n=1 Tax=Haliangium ochraceum (strain DSM 14365 / JCM 11303 / SMP-2) TaxID=502025 RepID=D0LKW8_HALO1|nr:DUF882 domain-containing protein [Haliangium ochraceum]ACY16688.1 protein of unknown function DUF882 [Haliangium ochraceum DSM 14365]